MKQTAIEFLVDNLHYLHSTKWDDIIEQAKEMEKQNLYNFYMQGGVDAIFESERTVEQYYNKTFKSE